MTFIYKIIYNPAINFIIRNAARIVNSLFKTQIEFPVSGILKLKSPKRKPFLLKTNETCFAANLAYWKGVSNYESSEIFCEILEKSNSFFDIGANVGLFTVLAGIHSPKARVDAFDPSPSSALYTKYNIDLNKLTNAHIHQLAMCDTKGKAKFHEVLLKKYLYRANHLSGSSSLDGEFTAEGKEYTVNTISIDAFVTENNLLSLDFIKIDAERAEPMIIKGAKETIKLFAPIIYCEVQFGMMHEMEILIGNAGYSTYQLIANRMIKIADPLNFKYSLEHNFLFVPNAKTSLISKFVV